MKLTLHTDRHKLPRMERIILHMPVALLQLMEAFIPVGQSRAEWIREAVRERISRENQTRNPPS